MENSVNEAQRAEMISYLQIIGNTIDRMGSNSAILKGFAATVLAGISALASITDVSVIILAVTLLPVLLFGYLDVKYFQIEKKYRILYEQVRLGQKSIDFSMKINFTKIELKEGKATLCNAIGSWSIWPFYGLLVIIGMILVCLKLKGCI